MTATTIKSEGVTALEANDHSPNRKKGILKTLIDQDVIPTTSTDEANDVFLFGPLPSDAIVLDFTVLRDDLESAGGNLAVNCGVFYSGIGGRQSLEEIDDPIRTSGTVIDADAFASAVTTFQSAGVTYTSLRFEAANITSAVQPLWEVAGLSADPGGYVYLGFTVSTAGGTEAEGDVVVRVDYI